MSSSGKTHTLTIRNVQLSDFGNYSCVVVNSIGREKKYIELSGKPGPPIVTSSGYSNPHEYNLTWVVQSVFPIIEVRILYRRMLVSVPIPPKKSKLTKLLQINSTYHHPGQWHDLLIRAPQLYNPATSERHQWYPITNLVAESVYECLVQAKNQHGFGELSDPHQWFSSQRGRLLHSGGGVAKINTFWVIVMICSFLLQ